MTLTFRPARRSEAKPLIGLYAQSGCGKTLSALYLARGFVGPQGRIGMIETESGRGEAYAEIIPGGYDVLSLRDDFSSESYGEAISAAEKAELGALVIDSASHEWEATGGVLEKAARNELAGKKGVLVWQEPKMSHQRHFILRLLSTPIPLVIVCMRAKYPMQEKLVDGKKTWVRSEQLEPTQSEGILSELFTHGWIDREHRWRPTKYTLDSLRPVLREGEPISIETGKRLAEWAAGDAPNQTTIREIVAGASRGESAIPEDAPKLLARIKAGFDRLKTSADVQVATWQKHCQSAPFMSEQTDVSLLDALLADLRAQAKKSS